MNELFAERPASVGTFFKSNSAMVAEALGHTPLDFLLIDRQHASPDLETMESVIRAGELNSLPSVVRIDKANQGLFVNILDLGAQGLMIPQTNTADEITEIADAIRYQGNRSYAMSTRAGRFGNRDREEYLEWVNNDLVLLPQIESPAGVKNVEEIASVDAVTSIMVGPADLALSHDLPIGDETVDEMVDEIFERVAPLDCGLGMYAGTPEDLNRYRSETEFLIFGSDVGTLTSRYSDTLE
ncbi:aldolase/citrate lyase family protein [Haloferax sp. AB510]|uniref:HpcH/HpaI aldolase family protein n=1 Tax=Haloferax sp. AB510 TaxID=2934172 RepID=UPI00209BEF6D|nr:aldolase/citrate lyase family protein [Haloferax sp. AB510]MCO8267150.1 aldolase/citrate lyase family protein [Haloferax sp. AB510]